MMALMKNIFFENACNIGVSRRVTRCFSLKVDVVIVTQGSLKGSSR